MKNITSGIEPSLLQGSTNLVGKKGTLKINDKNVVELYPFNPMNKVPVEIIQETKHFVTCKVLPHLSSNPMNFGLSREYNITVDKFYLFNNIAKISIN